MKNTRETDKEKIMRMERQMSRLKFKQAKQLAAMQAEIDRLNAHVAKGKGLLARVTSQIGGKQLERDVATARLEAVMTMLACIIGSDPILVPLEEFKATKGKWRVKTEQVEGGYLLSTEVVTEDIGGGADEQTADTVPPLVPAQDEGTNAGQPGDTVQVEPEPGIPADQ